MELALLYSVDELSQLSSAIRGLAAETLRENDTTCLPDYFVPRLAATHRPRVVLCFEHGRLVGVVYTQQRTVAGAGTGWLFGGDKMGRGLVLAAPEREAEVLATACDHLLRHGAHALRFRWRSTGHEALPILRLERQGIQVWCRSEFRPNGDWLHLGTDYRAFLERLGPRTRRNLRYYRRRAAEQGVEFVPNLTLEAYESAVAGLALPADVHTLRQHDTRDRRFLTQLGNPFGKPLLAGLTHPDGRLLAVAAGVRSGNHLHLLSQFNDESLPGQSLSLTLRSYLIEHLIDHGISRIHFVNGTSAALGRYCDPVLLRSIAIDSRRSPLHPVKLAAAHAARRWRHRGHPFPPHIRNLLGTYMATR
jgi:Acetyltransferase (GNAT) domain